MSRRPPLDRALADRMLARGLASARRRDHLTALARRHGVELPPLPVDDERAVDDALALLEQAGADIDWDLVELPNTLERPPA